MERGVMKDDWVVDEDMGEVLRPEGYFWQDLRTRCLYGGVMKKGRFEGEKGVTH